MTAAISYRQGKLLKDAVEAVAVQAEARAVLLTDWAGNILANTPYGDEPTLQTLGALGAGSFAATRELAALTGERSFNSISHQGSEIGIYARSLDETFLLLVIFDRTTTLGLVKLYVEKAVEELVPVLRTVAQQSIGSAGGTAMRFELTDGEPVFKMV